MLDRRRQVDRIRNSCAPFNQVRFTARGMRVGCQALRMDEPRLMQ
jgi:hypothetical protein